jgi:hypothetical protein
MPALSLQGLADVNGVDIKSVEKKWDKAKSIAEKAGKKNDHAYIMGIVKKMLDQKNFEFENDTINHQAPVDPMVKPTVERREIEIGDGKTRELIDIHNVPMFSINDKKLDERTGKRIEINEKDLDLAVANFNEEKNVNNYLPPIKEDHTLNGPKIGLVDNVKRIGGWVYGTMKNILPEYFNEVISKGKFSYRSMEYLPKSKRFVGLALLGSAPPEIKMPPLEHDALTFAEGRESVLCYGKFNYTGEKEMPEEKKEEKVDINKAFKGLSDEDKKKFMASFKMKFQDEEKPKEKDEKKDEDKKDEEKTFTEETDEKVETFSELYPEVADKLQKYEDENRALKEEFITMKSNERMIKFEADVKDLATRKAVDVTEMLEEAKGKSDKELAWMLAFAEKTAQEIPVNVSYHDVPYEGAATTTKVEKIQKYADEKKLSFSAAYEEILQNDINID